MQVISLADRRKVEPEPTKFTHDNDGKILPPNSPQPEGDYHLSNTAVCELCEASYPVVIPVGAPSTFQCIECQHDYAHLIAAVCPREVWTCKCGGQLFHIDRNGPMCIMCGAYTTGWF